MRFPKLSIVLALALSLQMLAWGQGVNFSVKSGSRGFPGTGVANQFVAESPANDVFIGGGCINHTRLLHAKLGLLQGDDIDALCYQIAPFIVDVAGALGEPGWFTTSGMPIFWHFSVDPQALGKPGSAVALR